MIEPSNQTDGGKDRGIQRDRHLHHHRRDRRGDRRPVASGPSELRDRGRGGFPGVSGNQHAALGLYRRGTSGREGKLRKQSEAVSRGKRPGRRTAGDREGGPEGRARAGRGGPFRPPDPGGLGSPGGGLGRKLEAVFQTLPRGRKVPDQAQLGDGGSQAR